MMRAGFFHRPMSDSSNAEFSLLLWLLGLGVATLAAHLSQAWVRVAQGRIGGNGGSNGSVWRQWRALLLAAGVMGTGLCSAVVLGLGAEALPFPIGYAYAASAGLWLAAMGLCLPAAALAAKVRRTWWLLGAGVLLALAAAAVQAGWIWAAGFRPGILWQREWVALAVLVLVLGLSAAMWVAHSEAAQASQRRSLWRAGGAVLAGVTLMAGQVMLMFAAGVPSQRGSVYQDQLPGFVLCLVCGVLVTLVMAGMSLDLMLRRQQRSERSAKDFNPHKRRKRRHRMRQL